MPIRPENKNRYPSDWQERRKAILQRAGDRCEWCGVKNGAEGWRDAAGAFHVVRDNAPEQLQQALLQVPAARIIRIVLTVAHVDHGLEDHSNENLAALCQRCHNRHDVQDRINGRQGRRRSLYAVHQLALRME